MKDLCQVCRNFCVCPLGEGHGVEPEIKQKEVVDNNGVPQEIWEVVECDIFWEYPRKED